MSIYLSLSIAISKFMFMFILYKLYYIILYYLSFGLVQSPTTSIKPGFLWRRRWTAVVLPAFWARLRYLPVCH